MLLSGIRSAVPLLSVLLLGGCSLEIPELTAEDRAVCDTKVKELTGHPTEGPVANYNIRIHNGVRSVRITYEATSDLPAVICNQTEGKVTQVATFNVIFPTKGQKI